MRADPLERWITMSDAQDMVLANLGRGEILDGVANKAGKTTLAVVFVALARGRRTLGGFDLPSIPQPSSWVVASLDFKQQLLSVQPKYLEALGDWPHKPRYNGDHLESLRIKYEGCASDDPKDWSLITFISAKNTQSGTGFRGNGYHCDEPMPMWLLRELRKMGESGSILVGLITATLIKRSQWQPLRPDYPPEFEGQWHKGFLRIRGPAFNPLDLDDTTVGNRALTRADKQALMDLYANDPDKDARILGLEIDSENSNPLRMVLDEIRRQFDEARDGDIVEWKVTREVPTPVGKQLLTEIVEVEEWEEVDSSCVYRVIVDTSMGIDDGAHDPGMAQVVNMTHRTQVARYQGFIGEYGMGVLAGSLSKKWNNGRVDVATTGGYGEACLSGLRAAGCTSLVSRQIKSKDGKIDRTDIGFKENADTRKEFVGALIEVFKAARAGHPFLTIRSRADLAELLDLSFDDKDRTVRVPGVHHGEVLTTMGRFATLCSPEKKLRPIPPASQKRPLGPIDMLRKQSHLPVSRRRDPSVVAQGSKYQLPRSRVRWGR